MLITYKSNNKLINEQQELLISPQFLNPNKHSAKYDNVTNRPQEVRIITAPCYKQWSGDAIV